MYAGTSLQPQRRLHEIIAATTITTADTGRHRLWRLTHAVVSAGAWRRRGVCSSPPSLARHTWVHHTPRTVWRWRDRWQRARPGAEPSSNATAEGRRQLDERWCGKVAQQEQLQIRDVLRKQLGIDADHGCCEPQHA